MVGDHDWEEALSLNGVAAAQPVAASPCFVIQEVLDPEQVVQAARQPVASIGRQNSGVACLAVSEERSQEDTAVVAVSVAL